MVTSTWGMVDRRASNNKHVEVDGLTFDNGLVAVFDEGMLDSLQMS